MAIIELSNNFTNGGKLMKKELKGFVIGILFAALLMGMVVNATGIKKTVEIVFNSVNLSVNGSPVDADTILYEGTTYVPLKAVASMLGKEVGWDGATKTASINDKGLEPSVAVPVSEWKEVISFEGSSTKDTQTFKITGDEWRIVWETSPGTYGDGVFQIYTYKSNGDIGGVDANVIGKANDTSYKRGSGEYYFTINTTQPYKIVIEQK